MEMMTRFEWLALLETNRPMKTFPPEVQEAIDRLFPNVDPGVRPFGQRVLVQLRLSKKYTRGGIALVSETQDTERWNEAVAQVVALGQLAFRKRDTLEPWGEGVWASVGDFVRVPRFGGDRWEVPTPDQEAGERQNDRRLEVQKELGELLLTQPLKPSQEDKVSRLKTELRSLDGFPPEIMVMFAQFNDYELIGSLTGNPVDMKVYV